MSKWIHRSNRSQHATHVIFSLASIGVLAVITLLSGCASVPSERFTAQVSTDELAAHVDYLASPKLGGRKTRTAASARTRAYIASRYRAAGLQFWGSADSYDQPFIIGTNVVGVLPGSDPDPQVRSEFVILSAHYDHLGWHDGKLHVGAADNAAGVAVMLEVLEQLASSPTPPRRTIVFAAWDAEEIGLFGSNAFTCRSDFDPAKLAGVVNLDMLGRKFLDVVDNTLLAFGTEAYPNLRNAVMQAGKHAGLHVLPLGRDLVGPRSDHAAFETFAKPWVFFTCGQYSDYHKPTDTPDKLDRVAMVKSARLVTRTVRMLANQTHIETATPPAMGDREELAAIARLLSFFTEHPKQAKLTEKAAARLAELAKRANELQSTQAYTLRDRQALAADLAEAILPILASGSTGQKYVDNMMVLRDLYLYYPRLALEGSRELMSHILRHRPGVFRGTPDFHYRRLALNNQSVHIANRDDGSVRLSVLVPRVEALVQIGWFGQHKHRIEVATDVVGDCIGSTDDLIDYCLLKWASSHDERDASEVWSYTLRRLTRQDLGGSFDRWKQWRLNARGQSYQQWVLAHLNGDHPMLMAEAIDVAAAAFADVAGETFVQIAGKTDLPARVRAQAISVIGVDADRDALLTLVGLLNDQTQIMQRDMQPACDPTYPFYHYGRARLIRRHTQERDQKPPLIADRAHARLTQLLKQDLGNDAQAWANWIDSRPQQANRQHAASAGGL